ncbi:hypothetical protein IWW45_003664 [Coemansia sp. RSA 485]|nr:hypothetical protein IWW45_003664 [Coemansia sp. RSA 485]
MYFWLSSSHGERGPLDLVIETGGPSIHAPLYSFAYFIPTDPKTTTFVRLLWEGTFVMHATLFDESGTREYSAASIVASAGVSAADECYEQMALGSLASSAHHVRDLEDKRGCFFCFPDIRVRHPGRFRLRFTLIRLQASVEPSPDEPISVLEHVFSEPFTVYTVKDFPGVDESTALSKKLNHQGVGIPIRNKGRLKYEDEDDEGGTASAGYGNND